MEGSTNLLLKLFIHFVRSHIGCPTLHSIEIYVRNEGSPPDELLLCNSN